MRFVLAVALLAVAACDGVPSGDLRINWTFGDGSCSKAGVTDIMLEIPGLNPRRTTYACSDAPDGVDVGTLSQNNYEVIVTGYDSAHNPTYKSDDVHVRVAGDSQNLFTIDAAPQLGAPSFTWTFAGQSCASAGVTRVEVFVEGAPLTDLYERPGFDCSESGSVDFGDVFAGTRTFDLYAQAGSVAYAQSVTIPIYAFAVSPQAVDLAEVSPAASALVSWTFANSPDCTAAGVDTIEVVIDPHSDGSGGTTVGYTTCAASDGSMEIFDVPDGSHSFGLSAFANGKLTWYAHSPVSANFAAVSESAVSLTAEPAQ